MPHSWFRTLLFSPTKRISPYHVDVGNQHGKYSRRSPDLFSTDSLLRAESVCELKVFAEYNGKKERPIALH